MLHITDRWRPVFNSLDLTSCEAASAHFLRQESQKRGVTVVQRELETAGKTERLFFKQYYYSPASWRFLGRPAKAAREAQSYAELARLGLAVPEVICWGEDRDTIGRLRQAVIATVAVPDAVELPDFLKRTRHARNPQDQATRRAVLNDLADSVRRMHAACFYHHDLVGRNLLYSSSTAAGRSRLWWIDCPRGAYDHWSPMRPRKRLRDLAGLDKTGAQFCSRVERLRWLLAYLGKSRLSPEDKLMARSIVAYRLAH